MKRSANSLLVLPLFVLLIFFLAASFSLVYSDWLDRKRLVAETSERALESAARLARQATNLHGEDVDHLEQEIMLQGAENLVAATALVDPDGKVIFAQHREWKGRPAAAAIAGWDAARFEKLIQGIAADVRVDWRRLRISVLMPYVAAPVPGQTVSVRRGALLLEYDVSSALDLARHNNFVLRLPDLGVVLVCALLLAVWMQRRVIAPLRDVTAASRKIAEGDLRARATPSGGGEISELALHFNRMAEAFERELQTRNELSAKLQLTNERLSRLTAQIPGVVFQFRMNADGRFDMPFVSPSIREHYGLAPEDLARDAEPLINMVAPADRTAFDASIAESARTLQPWHHEWRTMLPNGETHWHSGSSRPEPLPDGGVVWHGFFTDISERKQIEERQRLAASVFDTAGEAIMVTDAEGVIVAVNPAFCRITGFLDREVIGRTPTIIASGRHDREFHRMVRESLRTYGFWAGEIWNKRKNGEIFPEWQTINAVKDDVGEVTHYVAVFADLSEIRSAQSAAENLSWRDQLTGLANRALFLRQMEQTLACAQRDSGYAEILLIDIDRFKDINEARGLAVGDTLLKAIAERLARALRPDDVLARLNADEFAIILPRLSPTRDEAGREALAVAEKLRMLLLESIEMEGELFHLDSSIGIAVLPDGPEETASDALRRADMAMHQAKSEGGGRVVFFEAAMGDSVRERFRLERELRQAVSENQLRLYLQPQVNAAGKLVGSEALVRWQHPERGLVPPVMFIPIAEATDLIVALDRWVLAEVCRLLAQLAREGRALRISVNISPRHFRKDDFVDEIKRLLAASGAAPHHLMLEVTEGMVIGDVADVVAKMTELSALGIHFSMDDFGTGYSSLAYLKRLPIHELKIDKSFIQDSTTDPNDAALVETILSVAQHLRLQVVAEGVETQEQADFLNARAEVIHQGYLFGRPEPVEKWLALLG